MQFEKLYREAKGFIFTSPNEDFGIAPVEAMAHGVPVIAYYGGGVKETLQDKITGFFFYQHTVDALINLLNKREITNFKPVHLYKYVQEFSETRFKKEFRKYVNKAI